MKSTCLLVLTILAASACGGSQSQPSSADNIGAAEPPPAAAEQPAPATWSNDLTKEQKAAYMKEKVAPRMAPVLQAFETLEGHKDAEVGCQSCHGPNWQLPKDYLPKLKMKDGELTAFKDAPEAAKFMAERMVPEMAGALGVPVYDPATKQGFGCAGCHTIETE